MANLLLGNVNIVGTRPLLWHAFTPASIPLTKQERSGVAGNDPREWEQSVLLTNEQRLFLPGAAFFGCLREAAQHTRKGRSSIQRLVAATLQVADERFLTNRTLPDPLTTDPTQSVYLDIRSVVNPTTRARNVRYRVASSPGWQVTFSIIWDRTVVSRGEMEAVIRDAGRLVGLGSGRQIGLGRFRVTAIEIVDLIEVEPAEI